jgi:hypothetical protein
VVTRAHLDVLEEKGLSRSSEIEPRFLIGHARGHVTGRTAAVPFVKIGLVYSCLPYEKLGFDFVFPVGICREKRGNLENVIKTFVKL